MMIEVAMGTLLLQTEKCKPGRAKKDPSPSVTGELWLFLWEGSIILNHPVPGFLPSMVSHRK